MKSEDDLYNKVYVSGGHRKGRLGSETPAMRLLNMLSKQNR